MNTNTVNRSRVSPRRDISLGECETLVQLVCEPQQSALDTDVVSARLLRDAVREAGLFQRSVLGHLDHKEWRDRVRADGQRLIDLLSQIGFKPTDNRV